MHIRISKQQLRLRITNNEFATLLKQGELSFTIELGTIHQCYSIILSNDTKLLTLSIIDHTWQLLVNPLILTKFATTLPSRKGLEHTILVKNDTLKLILEVDILDNHEI